MWCGSGSNQLKLKTQTSGTYNSNCSSTGTNVVVKKIITSTAPTTTLNDNFVFGSGGDVMFCYIQTDNRNKPSYRITLHYTEHYIETNRVDGDIIWIIERFYMQESELSIKNNQQNNRYTFKRISR
jgi:hypothetical protein